VPFLRIVRGDGSVAKDKKKKKKDKKHGSDESVAAKAAKGIQGLTQNPLVADVVAAALVATASALKDTNKARRLAEYAGDELEVLSKKSAQRGNAMWKLALDIGRQALETFTSEEEPPSRRADEKSAPKKRGSAKKSNGAKKSGTAKKSANRGKAASKKRSVTGRKAK
jgi:hypothetical protein